MADVAEIVAKEIVTDALAKAEKPDDPELNADAIKSAFIAGSSLAIMDLNDTMVFPFLADFFLERDVTVAAVGMVFAAVSVGMLIFAFLMPKLMPLIGGPSRTLALGISMFAVVRLMCAMLPLVGTGTPLLVASLIVFLLTGCVYAFSEVGALSWVLYTAPKGQKVPAMAALMTSRMMGALFGTPVGGILFDLIGWPLTNIVGGISLLVPLAFFHKGAPTPLLPRGSAPRPLTPPFVTGGLLLTAHLVHRLALRVPPHSSERKP